MCMTAGKNGVKQFLQTLLELKAGQRNQNMVWLV